MEKIKARILGLMADVFEVLESEIADDATPDTLEEWDSLKHLILILALQEEFDVTFSDQEIAGMLNLPLIIEVLSVKCGTDK